MLCRSPIVVALLLLFVPITAAQAEEPKKPVATAAPQTALIKKLEKDLTGVKLVGRFTVTGKEEMTPKEEEYTILSATKLDEGDLWLLKARIKYGKTDGTFPIPLEIKWAGDTPIISMTKMGIPNLGTFSARVIIYEGRYAGTWQHDAVGGHLFGTIEKAAEAAPADSPK